MKTKNENILFYVLLAISVILVIFSIWLMSKRPIETRFLDTKFMIGSYPGLGITNKSVLEFGMLVSGGSAVRRVNITHNYEFPVKVEILASENIVDFISVDSNVIIVPGENKSIPVTVYAIPNASYGNYSGRIKLDFYKVKS